MGSNIKRFEELEIRDDFMFGVIMRNPKYCKPFLETVLNIKIGHIEYPKSQEIIDLSADAKGVRLDVYVEDGKGTVYNIEMQTTIDKNIPKRMRYYQGMIDLNILEKGEDYRSLKKSFVIFVCTFDLFGQGRHVYTFENRCVQDLELQLSDDTVKIILNTKGILDDVSIEMKSLLDYIDGKEPEDDFTKELDDAVNEVRDNEKWRLEYMTLQMSYQEKYELGVQDGIELGREQGIEQGLQQGIQQGIQQGKEQAKIDLVKEQLNNYKDEELVVLYKLDIETIRAIRKEQEMSLTQ